MPLRLSPLESLLARFDLLPAPLFDTPLGPGIAKALVVACEMGIFDLLDGRSRTNGELTTELNCHPEALLLLLQILVSAGYIRQRGSSYSDTPLARRWLASSSSLSIAPYVVHSPDIVEIWDHLPELLHDNQAAMQLPYAEDPNVPENRAALERHYAGLASLAMVLGRELVLRTRLPVGATKMLDVGGSHGVYSALYCQKNLALHSTILDIPIGLEAGHRTAKKFEMEDRLSFVPANIVEDDFPALLPQQKYDVALYFQIAHLLPADLNRETLSKVARTLRHGGMLVYLDQIPDRGRNSHLTALMVQLMTLATRIIGGTTYPFSTVKDWLQETGFGEIKRHRLLTPGAHMITARKI